MKRFVFVARDPGAFAAVYPVFLKLSKAPRAKCKLFCFGTAAKTNADFAESENEAQTWLRKHLPDISVFVCGTGFHT